MTKAYVRTVGRMAYMWGRPLVNAANRSKAFAKAPEPGLEGALVRHRGQRITSFADRLFGAEVEA